MIFCTVPVSTSQYLDFFICKSLDGKIIILKTHTENGITTQYIHCREEGGIQSENKPRPLAVFNCYISSYISHLRNIYIYTKSVVLFTRYMRMFLWSIKAKRKNSLITTEYRWKKLLKVCKSRFRNIRLNYLGELKWQ